MPILHLGPLQLEMFRRPLSRMMIPSIAEQDTADIQKYAGDRLVWFHGCFHNARGCFPDRM